MPFMFAVWVVVHGLPGAGGLGVPAHLTTFVMSAPESATAFTRSTKQPVSW